MKKVFIGGSRRVSRLSASVRERIDRIIENNLPIVIGDANGADKAVQRYLHANNYRNVEVFCSGDLCRNNLGGWNSREVPAHTRDRSFSFYAAKDRAMADEASYGLMVWDGSSTGTLLNALRLIKQQKKVVLYSVPEKQFFEFRNILQWGDFVSKCGSNVRDSLERKADLETDLGRRQPEFLPRSVAPSHKF